LPNVRERTAAYPRGTSPRKSGGSASSGPTLVAEVAFTEWTDDGKIRHPSFQGLRTDKSAREVVRETAATPPPASRVRAALQSSSFVEGWAHYCEQMMLEEGFGGNNPKLRLAQLQSAALGLCRYLAGIRLHAEGMSYEQAVEFFAREGHLPRSSAEREARRGALDPTCLSHTLA